MDKCNCPACRANRGEQPNAPITEAEAEVLRSKTAELAGQMFANLTEKLPEATVFILGFVRCNLTDDAGYVTQATLELVQSQLYDAGVNELLGHLERTKSAIITAAEGRKSPVNVFLQEMGGVH